MEFKNTYEDSGRATAYAELGFQGTYYLAYRDLPRIIAEHVSGKRAIDFGCGTGRSTRFLKKLGFKTIGVDIAGEMIKKAREQDLRGDYRLIEDGNLHSLNDQNYDLILSVFTFDNIPTMDKKVKIFKEFARLLDRKGRIVHLVSSPEIYTYEWASFSTKAFPENNWARCGDKVKIIIEVLKRYKPLAKEDEPYHWINETLIAPWVIYVIRKVEERFHP